LRLINSPISWLTGLPIHLNTWPVCLSRPLAHHHFQTTATIKTSKCKRKKETIAIVLVITHNRYIELADSSIQTFNWQVLPLWSLFVLVDRTAFCACSLRKGDYKSLPLTSG